MIFPILYSKVQPSFFYISCIGFVIFLLSFEPFCYGLNRSSKFSLKPDTELSIVLGNRPVAYVLNQGEMEFEFHHLETSEDIDRFAFGFGGH